MNKNIRVPEAFGELFKSARYKAYFGGRGSAKSHSAATAALLLGGKEKKRIGCFREVQLSIKDSIKQLLDDKIKVHGMEGFYTSLQNEIRGKNGTNFIFAGLGRMTTDQIKSMEGIDIAIIEEAQTISERSLEVLIPTIRKPGSELWFLWNPRHQVDPVDKLFRGEVVPENAVIRKVTFKDNSFFPQVLREEMEFDKRQKPDRFDHIWMGDYEPQAIGALWNRTMLHNCRRDTLPEMQKVVVAIDPAVSNEKHSDEHGVMVCGLGADKKGYLLEDGSLKGSPRQAATRAVALHDKWQANTIIYEKNQGGLWIEDTIKSIRQGLRVEEVCATRGKYVRAEPVSSLYELGVIHHYGTFDKLENQMCLMVSGDYAGEGSPDRVCAAVWGFTHLFPQIVQKKAKRSNGPGYNRSWQS